MGCGASKIQGSAPAQSNAAVPQPTVTPQVVKEGSPAQTQDTLLTAEISAKGYPPCEPEDAPLQGSASVNSGAEVSPTQADDPGVEGNMERDELDDDEEVPYEPLAQFLSKGMEGDAEYRRARIKARNSEPCKPPSVEEANPEVVELKRVWQEEWYGFPAWNLVLLTRAATGRKLWRTMSTDRRRAACERFALCGPWAASQEPDASQLACMRATSSSPLFVLLEHPARRELFIGAFCAAHGLAVVEMLQSDRPHNPSYYDSHGTTSCGKTMTTAEVCYRIIVPATRAFGASYADLFLGPDLWGEAGRQAKEGADGRRFLSHAWGMPFMEMITVSIIEGAPPRHDAGPYWIDIFCKNQHVPIKETDLTDNILGSQGVVLSVYPWPAPLLTTRVWCLFEVLTAVQTRVTMRLKFCPSAASKLYSAMNGKYSAFNYSRVRSDVKKNGLSSVLPGASELIAGIDVRQAVATVPADRDMIMRLIDESVGPDQMNEVVREMLAEGLTASVADVVEAIVGQSRMEYNSYEPGWD